MITIEDIVTVQVQLKSNQNIQMITDNTHNTWQPDRDNETKRKDTLQGKIAEQAVIQYLEGVSTLRYVPYDTIRADNFQKHAPFDGLLCKPDQNIQQAVDKINNDIQDNLIKLSRSTRAFLQNNYISIVEIKSTKISDKIKNSSNNMQQSLQRILKQNHFLTYPSKCRYSVKDLSLQEYFQGSSSELYEQEKHDKANIHIHCYTDNNTVYIMGFIFCHEFFEQPLLTRFYLKNKSEYALYFGRILETGHSIKQLGQWHKYSPINNVTLSDCTDFMKTLSDESIDLIIADPPYYKICGDFDYIWSTEEEYLEWTKVYLTECKRILKDTGTLMLWGGLGKNQIMLCRIAVMIEDLQLFMRQNWITQRNTRGIGTQRNYMSAREDLLFLTKTDQYTFNIPYLEERSIRKDLGANGKPRTNTHKRVSNVWYDISEASQSSIERCAHPTVKAQALCDRIIRTHSNPGDLIYIPFTGSGSECISALYNGRNYITTENDYEYYLLARNRIPELLNKRKRK